MASLKTDLPTSAWKSGSIPCSEAPTELWLVSPPPTILKLASAITSPAPFGYPPPNGALPRWCLGTGPGGPDSETPPVQALFLLPDQIQEPAKQGPHHGIQLTTSTVSSIPSPHPLNPVTWLAPCWPHSTLAIAQADGGPTVSLTLAWVHGTAQQAAPKHPPLTPFPPGRCYPPPNQIWSNPPMQPGTLRTPSPFLSTNACPLVPSPSRSVISRSRLHVEQHMWLCPRPLTSRKTLGGVLYILRRERQSWYAQGSTVVSQPRGGRRTWDYLTPVNQRKMVSGHHSAVPTSMWSPRSTKARWPSKLLKSNPRLGSWTRL